ncbi:MAG: hypothetical protein EPN40_00550 [Rhodanobacteraceae bacterium]|nr:MAG: hypothetical protein EPN40_00550 [Rhodanobacteraceae bacterium]
MLTTDAATRWRSGSPFLALGGAAIIAGGLLAAVVGLPGTAMFNLPLRHFAWASAYLVLIVGVAQIVFGAGQAWLSARVPETRWVAGEWVVFNLGNAGVIAGTLCARFWMVLAGTLLFAAGIALFLLGTRDGVRDGWLVGYRVLPALIFLSSLVGLALALGGR